jgi:hypothetical protein
MILPRNSVSVAFSLAILALILTGVFWVLPTYPEDDLGGAFLNNFLSLGAFFIAAYWASGLERRIR